MFSFILMKYFIDREAKGNSDSACVAPISCRKIRLPFTALPVKRSAWLIINDAVYLAFTKSVIFSSRLNEFYAGCNLNISTETYAQISCEMHLNLHRGRFTHEAT